MLVNTHLKATNSQPPIYAPLRDHEQMDAGGVLIRAYSINDYDQVVNLWRLSGLTIRASDSIAELEKVRSANPNRFLVAESHGDGDEKRIVGAVIGAFDGRRGWIYHLAVLPDARRAGLGTALIHDVEGRLRADGAKKVNLLVEPGNEGAVEFYSSLGYLAVPLQFFTREL